MTDSGPIPIRVYREFTNRDWPSLPKDAQDALAVFLLELQKNPDRPEIVANASRDGAGRFRYEFSPGYVVNWQIAKNEIGDFVQPVRIEVLAVLKTGIEFLEIGEKTALGGDSPPAEQPDPIEQVYSRNATLGLLAMWGKLQLSRRTRKVKGWIVDSWSQGGPPYLKPKMHWVSFPDYKLYHMHLNIDFNSTIHVGAEDTDTEPERLVFIRGTLIQWEQDWIEEESKKSGQRIT